MAQEVKSKYPCSEDELYEIAEIGIGNLEEDLGLFTNESTYYDAAYALSRRALLTAARTLPNEEQRNGVHQAIGNLLPDLADVIKKDFLRLKDYIRKGWPGENPQPRWETAGLVKYNEIGERNWEKVTALFNAMNDFVTDAANAPLLTTPGGMPAGYPASIIANHTAFRDKYVTYMSTRDTKTLTADKLKANNAVYDGLMDFFVFGVETVMRESFEGQKRYTFKVLKDFVSPPGTTGIKVTVKTVGEVLVANRDVVLKKAGSPEFTIVTNEKGIATGECEAGEYAGKVVNADLTVVNFEKKIEVGVIGRVTVVVTG